MVKQIRSAMCTINFDEDKCIDKYDIVPDWEKLGFIKRAMGQLERGEKNGKLHWQIFLEFKYPIEETRIHGLGMHVDTKWTINGKAPHPKRGRNYVRKATEYVNSRFDWPEEFSVFEQVKQRRKEEAGVILAYEKLKMSESKEDWINFLKLNIARYESVVRENGLIPPDKSG